jgi:hypothetical protein
MGEHSVGSQFFLTKHFLLGADKNARGYTNIDSYIVFLKVVGLKADLKPELCNRLSITDVTRFESVAMLSKPNFLILCDLRHHHDSFCINQVKKKFETEKISDFKFHSFKEEFAAT